MIHADYLFLLTDVDGLYTANPRKDPSAKHIEVVTSISAIRSQGEIVIAFESLSIFTDGIQ
jgi:glutamate 5-kinase